MWGKWAKCEENELNVQNMLKKKKKQQLNFYIRHIIIIYTKKYYLHWKPFFQLMLHFLSLHNVQLFLYIAYKVFIWFNITVITFY